MIWSLVQDLGMIVHATYIPGVENIEADHASRFFRDDAEIMLKPSVFLSLCNNLNVNPTVNLIATRHNKQLSVFCILETRP